MNDIDYDDPEIERLLNLLESDKSYTQEDEARMKHIFGKSDIETTVLEPLDTKNRRKSRYRRRTPEEIAKLKHVFGQRKLQKQIKRSGEATQENNPSPE